MDTLFDCIAQYHPISVTARKELGKQLKKLELPRNSLLVKEGAVCSQLYFLEKGCLRKFYNLDGKEVTHWLGFENNFTTSFYSFISRNPGIENLQVLEDAVLWSVSYDDLQELMNKHRDLERMVRIIQEQYYIKLEERIMALQFKTAKERYEELMLASPHILQRISLGQIASYLGISQETLSRIRGQV
ncbi:MAG: Crp/Fnr family transcriptional regulator [Cytophagaceae bacterium]